MPMPFIAQIGEKRILFTCFEMLINKWQYCYFYIQLFNICSIYLKHAAIECTKFWNIHW